MEKPFQAPAILTSISYTKDGGVRLGFITQELSDIEKMAVSKYFQQFGYLLFKPNQFSSSDIPKEEAEEKSKTPSKRLRAVLFIKYQQEGGKGDFEAYYRNKMESIIEYIKSKLDK